MYHEYFITFLSQFFYYSFKLTVYYLNKYVNYLVFKCLNILYGIPPDDFDQWLSIPCLKIQPWENLRLDQTLTLNTRAWYFCVGEN